MEYSALSLLDLATELGNMGDMWGTTGANQGGNVLMLAEAINRVEVMQKTPPLVRRAARLPSNRMAKQLHDQAFQGKLLVHQFLPHLTLRGCGMFLAV